MKYYSIYTLVLPFIFFASINGQSCSNPKLRKEIRQLTQDELARYFNAIKKVHSTRSNDGLLSKYEAFSKTHYTNESYAHGTPRFLPWHRYFLRLYELELQKVEPTVVLPYWDWSKDYRSPASSPILSNAMMGSNGDRSRNYCVTNGQFANMQLNYPSKHCLQRSYRNGNSLPPFSSPQTLNSYLNYAKFSDFCSNLEDVHGDPHVLIGGSYDFRRMYSPNDPIFYLHHAFIDLLWYEWQQRHPNSNPYDGDAYGQNVSKDDSLVTWPTDVKSTFSTTNSFYCYTYPRYSSNSRTNSLSAQQPSSDQNLANPTSAQTQTLSSNQYGAIGDIVTGIINPNIIEGILRELESLDTDQAIRFLNIKLPQLGINLGRTISGGRIPKREPLPDDWIEMNRLNKAKVRQREQKNNKLIDLLNALNIP